MNQNYSDEQIMEQYALWLKNVPENDELYSRLIAMKDDFEQINDSFYTQIAFGTGGLRGKLGPGPNRMNVYTVERATKGIADYLNERIAEENAIAKVAIAFDSRINSRLFAQCAAAVFAAKGIKAYIYPSMQPTPVLSYTVRHLECTAGICITASHNPSEYNGYKAYGADGSQYMDEECALITEKIEKISYFDGNGRADYQRGLEEGMIIEISEDTVNDFLDTVYSNRLECGAGDTKLKVAYTPLNGTGRHCVTSILKRCGNADITIVSEQAQPDGLFPTCPYPNPEMAEALKLGIALCEETKADLLIASDPDCDRMALAPFSGGRCHRLSGNEVGVLFFDYICKMRIKNNTMPDRPYMITTIVSTGMIDALAEKYNVEVIRTLTGFKYIGGKIGELERIGRKKDFIFGFEESIGYMIGDYTRDKEGEGAAKLACDMAKYEKSRGGDLYTAMQELYAEHGYYMCDTQSFTFPGEEGMFTMAGIMNSLRECPPSKMGENEITSRIDYNEGINGMVPSNVLEYNIKGGKLVIRPSGTEPKIKAYAFSNHSDKAESERILAELKETAVMLIEK